LLGLILVVDNLTTMLARGFAQQFEQKKNPVSYLRNHNCARIRNGVSLILSASIAVSMGKIVQPHSF
jgi:hypothetical protein